MDWPVIAGIDRPPFVDRFTEDIENPSRDAFADRHFDRRSGRDGFGPADHAFRRIESHAADNAFATLLHDFNRYDVLTVFDPDGIIDGGHLIFRKPDVDDRADNLCHIACSHKSLFTFHLFVSSLLFLSRFLAQDFRTADDFGDVIGDLGLASLIVHQGQFI